jgi:hypothetical protein
MPTASGKETATEKADRVSAEDWTAYRAAITDEYRRDAAAHAALAHDVAAIGAIEYLAGERLTLRAGARREIEVDEGKLRAIALADAVAEQGFECIGYGVSFGLFAGRDTVRHSVRVRKVS